MRTGAAESKEQPRLVALGEAVLNGPRQHFCTDFASGYLGSGVVPVSAETRRDFELWTLCSLRHRTVLQQPRGHAARSRRCIRRPLQRAVPTREERLPQPGGEARSVLSSKGRRERKIRVRYSVSKQSMAYRNQSAPPLRAWALGLSRTSGR